ncbi:MAG: 3-oxoacyl-(acyl-carrier-protein) synthase [Myxococcota bacterium]|jgi:3-oxoacyl-(acyl-carrier-protein) synthase
MEVAITAVALDCALGADGDAVAAILAGEVGVRPHPPLSWLPSDLAGLATPSHRPWLKRRKDAKLMTRAARLGLSVCGRAVSGYTGSRRDLGLFIGVGREPPDDGEAEDSLAAAARDGLLDETLLAGRGRDLYPPLLPLKTLPNMILAHASINLGIQGDNGAWAGDEDAALQALRAGYWAVIEGRCPAALVGGADSSVELGAARDRLRRGRTGPPGEGAAAFLLQPIAEATAPIALLSLTAPGSDVPDRRVQLGDCGAAEGILALAIAVLSGQSAVIGPLSVRPAGGRSRD